MRSRISYSCSNCKKRKVKCDRRKPICTSCEKNRIPSHLCIYQDSKYALSAAKEKHTRERQHSDEILSSDTSGDSMNLEDFVFFKPKYDAYRYFGPTSWRTILKQSLQDYPIMLEISIKTHADIKKMERKETKQPCPQYPKDKDDCCLMLSRILPTYKECSKLLSYFLQLPELFFSCFNGDNVFEYFKEVFEVGADFRSVSVVKNCNDIKLSIVLSILTISSFIHSESKLEASNLIIIAKWLARSTELKLSMPNLWALMLLHELNKYEYDFDTDSEMPTESISLSMIVTFATSLGLGRDIEAIHDGNEHYIECLNNAWKYILFEDTLRSFRMGFQPMIRDDYVQHNLLENDRRNYKQRIKTLRAVNDMVNSYQTAKMVNLNYAIDRIKSLVIMDNQQEMDSLSEQAYLRLIDLTYIHSLHYIHFLKFQTENNKIELFKSSLLLFVATNSMINELPTGSVHCFVPYIVEIREALLRSTVFFLHKALILLVNYETIKKQSKQYNLNELLTVKGVNEFLEQDTEMINSYLNDVYWIVKIITDHCCEAFLKLSTVNSAAKSTLVFINHVLDHIAHELESIDKTNVNLVFSDVFALEEADKVLPPTELDFSEFEKGELWAFFG
ncbi:predicted protein [Scheffersomyces stipitis CBS 6054]|uniref:Zn(2)-C6 fungal-type domain-containing protein n=1 Tax=Scheffersomyces stipitis (strain ATCC 58785 / CBS 6054 / NBRC 10063 / NRRL Y-11545) TaxID=322104 RepID=A3LWL9_PICST|nr:predicted protein [Scheffersomyces stipitis CBS 6054]ABN67306.2 predicted protein [Scheffersomyces stipitis CBS 6054]